MKSLYETYASQAVYPAHVGGFVRWLKDCGWSVEDRCTSGPRSCDWWTVTSPEGDVFQVRSWIDGDVQIRTQFERCIVLGNDQYKAIVAAEKARRKAE